jgi:hypothetical protein
MESKTKLGPLESPCGCRAKPYQVKFCPLHAAATELLEAAKALLSFAEGYYDEESERKHNPAITKARAAIAKAQGEGR